jgi:hypothetical protein
VSRAAFGFGRRIRSHFDWLKILRGDNMNSNSNARIIPLRSPYPCQI